MEMEARMIRMKQATIWMNNLDKTDCMLWHKHIGFENGDNSDYCWENGSGIRSGMNLGYTHTFDAQD